MPGPPTSSTPDARTDTFELFDLKVTVVSPPGERILCGARNGDCFTLEGEMLRLPPGQGFSIYSLGALLPLLSGFQRAHAANDWMLSDSEVACPDPNCKSRLRIARTGRRVFRHSEVTAVPVPLARSGAGGDHGDGKAGP